MNIGAIGWWSFDNQGDLAMLAALRQGLAPHRVVAIDVGFPANSDTLYRLNRLDYVLLGGGTLIRGSPTTPFDSFDAWQAQLEAPLGVVGMGVDAVSARYQPAVEALLQRAAFFYVRDEASRSVLGGHPKVRTAPDLTFAHPLALNDAGGRVRAGGPVCGVNLRRSATVDPEPWVEAIARLPLKVRGIPLSSFDVFDEAAVLRQLDPASPARFSAALYMGLDLMIATAFHAVLFAVQAGVPVIAIDYAPKVRGFMQDIGMERYLLGPNEPSRLPELVAEVLAQRREIVGTLEGIRAELHARAQETMGAVGVQIERSQPRYAASRSSVTMAILGSGDAAKDQRSLASCAEQTHQATRAVLAPPDAGTSVGGRLKTALAAAESDYLGWVEGGDWLAEDALHCMASLLDARPQCEAVYADYYALGPDGFPRGIHTCPGPEKLYRRDVVGPFFVMRRSLVERWGPLSEATDLVSYDLWLRAAHERALCPFRAPLGYSGREIRSPERAARERDVRRQQRRTQAAWKRALWWCIDSELGERFLMKPAARALGLLRKVTHGKRG